MKKLVLLLSLIAFCYNDSEGISCGNSNQITNQICENIQIDGIKSCTYNGNACLQ